MLLYDFTTTLSNIEPISNEVPRHSMRGNRLQQVYGQSRVYCSATQILDAGSTTLKGVDSGQCRTYIRIYAYEYALLSSTLYCIVFLRIYCPPSDNQQAYSSMSNIILLLPRAVFARYL